jgi:hypothetical protein
MRRAFSIGRPGTGSVTAPFSSSAAMSCFLRQCVTRRQPGSSLVSGWTGRSGASLPLTFLNQRSQFDRSASRLAVGLPGARSDRSDLVRHLERIDGTLLVIVPRQVGLAYDVAAAISRHIEALRAGRPTDAEILAERGLPCPVCAG